MLYQVIGLTGQAGSGKSTVAEYLEKEYQYERVRFAATLKAMAYAFGLTVDDVEGCRKEQPSALLGGKSPRYFMQTLGTEWGRNLIDPDIWVNVWSAKARAFHLVVAEDCRFENERKAIRTMGGVIVRVVGDHRPIGTPLHASEQPTDDYDHTLYNTGSRDDLYRNIEHLIDAQ